MAKKTKATANDPTVILSDLDLSDAVLNEMRPILEQAGDLSGADITQARELADIIQRQADIRELQAEAKAGGDTAQWLSLGRLFDATSTTKRGLLRDMNMTRSSTSTDASSKVAAKAQGKAGVDWEGIL